jgi:hypothetical protein
MIPRRDGDFIQISLASRIYDRVGQSDRRCNAAKALCSAAVDSHTTFLARDPETCWRLFTDAASLIAWIPGLRRAEVIAKSRGLPSEIHFEFASSLVYTLAYSYDVERREVRWEPKLGKRDGVRGFARFEPFDDGTRMTYGLEHGDARTAADRELGEPHKLLEAFALFVRGGR